MMRDAGFSSVLTVLLFVRTLCASEVQPPNDDSGVALDRPDPSVAIDFFPPLLSLAGDVGVEWLFWRSGGVGLWVSGGAGTGDNWISGLEMEYRMVQAGFTWHPSRKLRSGAIYTRFMAVESEQEVADASNNVFRLRYVSQQVRAGYLDRDLLWRGLGYFWHAGLGYPVGNTRLRWLGEPSAEAETIGKWIRVAGFLDLGVGLSWGF